MSASGWVIFLSSTTLRICAYVFLRWVRTMDYADMMP